MTRSRMRRLKRVEEALGPDPSVDELYASIIWDFALTTDEEALKLVKQAFATVTGRPIDEEEEKEKASGAAPPLPPPVETAPDPPPAQALEAGRREAAPPEAETLPPQWVEVRWRPRGEPDPYYWAGDDYYNRPGTFGRAIVDYNPLAYGDDE